MADNGWKEAVLDELTETPLTYGVVKPGLDDPNGVPFVRGGDITGNRVQVDQLGCISPEVSEQYRRTVLRGGEILVSLVGTVGQIALAPDTLRGANIYRQIALIRPNNATVDTRFLRYFLLSSEGQQAIRGRTRGSVQSVINLRDLKTVRVPLPPLSEQKAIAEILGALDAKIDLNRRMNETLERMAQAIFKSWFVDFDPVKAKQQAKAAGKSGAGIRRAAMAALSGKTEEEIDQLSEDQRQSLAKTAELFPNGMFETELGHIPKSWKLVEAEDHLDVVRGLSYKGSGLADSGTPMHNLNSVKEGGGYKYHGIKYYTQDYKVKHITHPGDVIVANTEQGFEHLLIGFGALVPKCHGDALFSHHLYRVRPKNESPLTGYYILHLFLPGRFRRWVAGFTNGTTVNMLPTNGLARPQFPLPSAALVSRFSDIVCPIYGQIESNVVEAESLAHTRDALLPGLLAGELALDLKSDV